MSEDYYKFRNAGRRESFLRGAFTAASFPAVFVAGGALVDAVGWSSTMTLQMLAGTSVWALTGLLLAARNRPDEESSRGGLHMQAKEGKIEVLKATSPYHLTTSYNKAARVTGALAVAVPQTVLSYNAFQTLIEMMPK